MIGNNSGCYAAGPNGPLLYLAIIVLMFVIIHSLRRSIRDEQPLATAISGICAIGILILRGE